MVRSYQSGVTRASERDGGTQSEPALCCEAARAGDCGDRVALIPQL